MHNVTNFSNPWKIYDIFRYSLYFLEELLATPRDVEMENLKDHSLYSHVYQMY